MNLFQGFVKEAYQILNQKPVTGEDAEIQLRRDLHTLKGNAGLFGLNELMQNIGNVESKENIDVDDLRYLSAYIKTFLRANEDILELKWESESEIHHDLAENDLASLEQLMRATVEDEQAYRIVSRFARNVRMRTIRSLIGPVEDRVVALGRRMEKDVECLVEGAELRVDPERVEPVLQVLTHALRNAVDHEIEFRDERLKKKKRPEGNLRISFKVIDEDKKQIRIEVADDGRGIDEQKLVARSIEKGSISLEQSKQMTRTQKLELVFQDGVSTREEVTDISGRGVGMSALRDAVLKLGGTIQIFSRQEAGTALVMDIPLINNHELEKFQGQMVDVLRVPHVVWRFIPGCLNVL